MKGYVLLKVTLEPENVKFIEELAALNGRSVDEEIASVLWTQIEREERARRASMQV